MIKYYILRTYLSLSGTLYPVLAKLFSNIEIKGGVIASRDTDVVIEGYPRCGNSFAEGAFRVANAKLKPELNIAHHCHAAAQIKNAAKFNLPCLVVIRDPIDACVSNCIFSKNSILPKDALIAYCLFYEAILPYNNKFVLGLFEEITTNIYPIIESLNKHFKTNFHCPKHDNEFNTKTFDLLKKISIKRHSEFTSKVKREKDNYLPAGEDYSPEKSKEHHLKRKEEKDKIKKEFFINSNKKLVSRAYSIFNLLKKSKNLTNHPT